MKPFTTQQEVEDYDQRQQLAEMARLRGIKRAERMTVWEYLGIFAVMIFLVVVMPTIGAWLTR